MTENTHAGRLIVLTGPTAVGKGTVEAKLRADHPEVWVSVSATTRAPRPGEVDGVNYWFLTEDEFLAREAAGEFLETAVVHGMAHYGTLLKPVEEHLAAGVPTILEIDLQGARRVKQRAAELDLEVVYVFIAPPSFEELERRLIGRFHNESLPAAFIERLAARLTIVDDLEASLAGQTIEKVNVFSMPKQYYTPLLTALNQTGLFEVSSAIIGNIEINTRGVDKRAGLKRLCAELCIEPENVMAFGDATNDLGMLRWAKWSFAMENAHEPARNAARYKTASNEEDGVAQAIERYVL